MSLFFASGRHRSALVAWLVTVLGMPIGTAAPAVAHNVHVAHTLFGMHDATGLSPSRIHEGSVRLWDVGTQWREVEVAPGVYNWTRLDALVSAAQAAHESVTMVVAMTPAFYASSPTLPPHHLQRYRNFVRALMRRYRDFHGKRGIADYQVWNEANISDFWTGTPGQMARLTRAMYDVRNRFDPHAKVISPPMTTRRPYQLAYLQRYHEQRVNGTPVWRFYNVVALNLYPLARYGRRAGVPEDAIRLLHEARVLLHRAGVPRRKPIWNTEVNYGLVGGAAHPAAAPISVRRQAAYVMRTYLLNAANGVRRVFWYRYDMGLFPRSQGGGALVNTLLSVPGDPALLTPAGRAYFRVQQWMHGTLEGSGGHAPCRHDSHGTYRCVVKDSSGARRIYWNPTRRVRVRIAGNAREVHGVLGAVQKVRGGSTIRVDYGPVMVDSRR